MLNTLDFNGSINDQEMGKWTHLVKNILIDRVYLFFL